MYIAKIIFRQFKVNMRISFEPNVNFCALQKSYRPTVKELDSKLMSYSDTDVSFVELDIYNDGDLDALKCVSENWEQGLFVQNIYDDANFCLDDVYDKTHFYAITTQKSNFKNLDYQKILALTEVTEEENGKAFIQFIQANPESIFNPCSKYKCTGTALLDGLKDIYYRLEARPIKSDSVLNFYKKNNFVKSENSSIYCWQG